MGQITLRGLDPKIEEKIRQIADHQGKSINKIMLEMISKSDIFHEVTKKPEADSLKNLAGGWSKKEADRFFESIQSCEQIDSELWK